MAVPMTPSAAVFDFGGWKYHRCVPFNFLLSLAAPRLQGVLVLVTSTKFIAGVIVTAVINIHSRRSPRIFEKNRNGPMKYLGARVTMIHEKKPEVQNLVSGSL